MITTYLDNGCKAVKTSLHLKLNDDYSALWFCAENRGDLSSFLSFIVSAFNSFRGFFWLAFSGGTGSSKIHDLKRSFGHWSVSKVDVVSKHDSLDDQGDRLYSDIAQINSGNIDALAPILDRTLFGIDSGIFFLPDYAAMPSKDLSKPLVDLLVKRNGMGMVNENLLNQGLLESYIANILAIGGVATVTVRDSNMRLMVVAIGSQFTLNRMVKMLGSKSLDPDRKHIENEKEFKNMLSIGVSISAFS